MFKIIPINAFTLIDWIYDFVYLLFPLFQSLGGNINKKVNRQVVHESHGPQRRQNTVPPKPTWELGTLPWVDIRVKVKSQLVPGPAACPSTSKLWARRGGLGTTAAARPTSVLPAVAINALWWAVERMEIWCWHTWPCDSSYLWLWLRGEMGMCGNTAEGTERRHRIDENRGNVKINRKTGMVNIKILLTYFGEGIWKVESLALTSHSCIIKLALNKWWVMAHYFLTYNTK